MDMNKEHSQTLADLRKKANTLVSRQDYEELRSEISRKVDGVEMDRINTELTGYQKLQQADQFQKAVTHSFARINDELAARVSLKNFEKQAAKINDKIDKNFEKNSLARDC